MKKSFVVLFLFASTALMAGKCATNSIGMVECAKDPNGEAVLNNLGMVVCGKGQCAINSIGIVMCSKISGGGAIIDSIGWVRCQGGCEQASSHDCESPRMY